MDTFKSTLTLAALTPSLIAIGEYFGGQNGKVLAFLISVVFNFGIYFFSIDCAEDVECAAGDGEQSRLAMRPWSD